ncbi:MAG: hypothetical protein M3N53_14935 [Actinomycetota bacterium]|nr:hypothetical protein [Actinomycetota bacterium]
MFDKRKSRVRLEGHIIGVGFASGDRFVTGLWEDGPLGAMADVMWARPDGTKVLLGSRPEVTSFVGGVYEFDEHHAVEITARLGEHHLEVTAGPLRLEAAIAKPLKAFALRPGFLRRSPLWVRFEDLVMRPLAGRLLGGGAGVRLYGRSPSGVREWYCIDSYRRITHASATLDGRDLGPLAPLDPPTRFGFGEFPPRPAVVGCAPVLEGAEEALRRATSPEAAAPPGGAEPSPP